MPSSRCPRCGSPIADSASACAGCARPVTLDLTARVPRKEQRPSRRPLLRDGVLLVGGAGGIAAASVSDHWWLAGGIVATAALAAGVIHYCGR
jgi:fatty acid desaturase